MSLVVNHNMMAAHSSRILNSHYRKLSDSTRKLSSGLRVENAADRTDSRIIGAGLMASAL